MFQIEEANNVVEDEGLTRSVLRASSAQRPTANIRVLMTTRSRSASSRLFRVKVVALSMVFFVGSKRIPWRSAAFVLGRAFKAIGVNSRQITIEGSGSPSKFRRWAKSGGTSTSVFSLPGEWDIPASKELSPLATYPYRKGVPPSVLPNGGRVTMVGSGPGDPDLLTVSAYRLLTENPDALVIADRLVSPEILQLVAGEVKTARKLPGCADLAQEEIYWWAYQALAEGRHVIRLKIGDPFVFGRGGEEVLTFRRIGVEATVVPGVSAAFSAPLLGSIPVTHRGVSNQVVMCTGYGREGTSPDLIRFHKEQTVVFLMAVGRLKELCQRLQDQAGYPADTPVAIVEKAGCPDQRTVAGNMRTIADIAKRYTIKPPSTIVVGDVVNVLLEKNEHGSSVTGLVQNFTAAFV